ncbi:MAG TPA: tetratricopeptide repeat protein [Acidobacteriota bacterium]|nr:tetratricopeptide repeat protein [Acidobacteriota bacterium]
MDKLSKLRHFVERKPDDPFPLYGLAMEYKRLERLEEALQSFSELARRFPDYTPTYFHYAGTLVRAGLEEEAQEVYRRGIEVAGSNGDAHAQEELQAAMEEIAED